MEMHKMRELHLGGQQTPDGNLHKRRRPPVDGGEQQCVISLALRQMR